MGQSYADILTPDYNDASIDIVVSLTGTQGTKFALFGPRCTNGPEERTLCIQAMCFSVGNAILIASATTDKTSWKCIVQNGVRSTWVKLTDAAGSAVNPELDQYGSAVITPLAGSTINVPARCTVQPGITYYTIASDCTGLPVNDTVFYAESACTSTGNGIITLYDQNDIRSWRGYVVNYAMPGGWKPLSSQLADLEDRMTDAESSIETLNERSLATVTNLGNYRDISGAINDCLVIIKADLTAKPGYKTYIVRSTATNAPASQDCRVIAFGDGMNCELTAYGIDNQYTSTRKLNGGVWGNAWVEHVQNGRFLTITASGSDITLSAADANYAGFVVTGTLTANVNIIVPNTVRSYQIINNCSGAFTVTVKTAAGTGIVCGIGAHKLVFCDGTNVLWENINIDWSALLNIPTGVSALAAGTLASTALADMPTPVDTDDTKVPSWDKTTGKYKLLTVSDADGVGDVEGPSSAVSGHIPLFSDTTGKTIYDSGIALSSLYTYDAWRLGQTASNWTGITTAPNGDIYTSVRGGDIYKQTGGTGNFVALGQTIRSWYGLAAAPNGDIYASVRGGDIYKQTGGTGNFVALGQTSREWRGMAAAANGDIYACVYGGDIYKQSGGTGDFVALGQTLRNWIGIAAAPNGDIYAAVTGGDIYKQAGGTGDFVALGQTSRNWYGLAAAPNGDIYASVYTGGDIYKQSGGTGDFVALGQTSRDWAGMTATANGDVYACVFGGDIYTFKYIHISPASIFPVTVAAADVTVTENRFATYRFTGALTGNRVVTMPADVRQYKLICDCTGAYTVCVLATGQTTGGVYLAPGDTADVYCDGVAVVKMPVNAEELGGVDAASYALKTDTAASATTATYALNVNTNYATLHAYSGQVTVTYNASQTVVFPSAFKYCVIVQAYNNNTSVLASPSSVTKTGFTIMGSTGPGEGHTYRYIAWGW